MGGRVVIESLPQAFRIIKEMNLSAEGWESDYRVAGRDAVRAILEQRMRNRVSRRWLFSQMKRTCSPFSKSTIHPYGVRSVPRMPLNDASGR
jgi:hypothetical protein